jgi:hypothetical protein
MWNPMRARILSPVEARIAALEREWQRHTPAFAGAVSKANALGAELGRISRRIESGLQQLESARQELGQSLELQRKNVTEMWERIEFMRCEMLFEIKYTGQKSHNQSPVETRIVAGDKVANARQSGLRLNLGCGHIPLPGYVNVDQRALPNVDIVAEAGDLPIETGTAQEIFSAHLLEHFPQEELRRRLLPYWHSLLEPGGTFHAVVPDGEAMFAGLAVGTYPFEDFREVLFGGQDYEGDFHYNLFTPKSLSSLLAETGFADVRVVERGRRNGKCFEFEILASKAGCGLPNANSGNSDWQNQNIDG